MDLLGYKANSICVLKKTRGAGMAVRKLYGPWSLGMAKSTLRSSCWGPLRPDLCQPVPSGSHGRCIEFSGCLSYSKLELVLLLRKMTDMFPNSGAGQAGLGVISISPLWAVTLQGRNRDLTPTIPQVSQYQL